MTFEAEWARCAPWLEAALEYDGGLNRLDDVLDAVLAGEAHFWPGQRSVIVTEFWDLKRSGGRALHCWLAGGDLGEIVEAMRPVITAFAREQGCTRITITGRSGWARSLKVDGFRQVCVGMSKELNA